METRIPKELRAQKGAQSSSKYRVAACTLRALKGLRGVIKKRKSLGPAKSNTDVATDQACGSGADPIPVQAARTEH